MKTHGILFQGDMVRAILREIEEPGTGKTQTRRLGDPKYAVGDLLWARESWRSTTWNEELPPRDILVRPNRISYEADGTDETKGRLRPGIHMCKWMSRITMEVTEVRHQLLQDIRHEDAIAEGLVKHPNPSSDAVKYLCDWTFEGDDRCGSPISAFACLWERINGARGPNSWHANPMVSAYTFKPMLVNVEKHLEAA